MVESLEQVLANERGQAAVLRHNGHGHDAEIIERVCEAVQGAAREYLLWLSEGEAEMWSGHATPWLRARFEEWRQLGHAEMRGRRRYYRAIVLPRRVDLAEERERGRRGERRRSA